MRLLKEDDNTLNAENAVQSQNGSNPDQTDAVDLTKNNAQDTTINNAADKQTNWVERYRQAKNPSDVRMVIQEFLKTLNFKNYDETKFNKFVSTNLNSLWLECNKYGLSKDNPFFIFLQNYLGNNKTSIDVFFDQNKWDLLHNCVANDTLDENQLTFKSETKKQIRILFNPNLWNISPVSDIKFCIELYARIVDVNLNYFIKNGYVKAAFAEEAAAGDHASDHSAQLVAADMDDPTNTVGLLKCLFMTNYIEELDNNKVAINAQSRQLDNNGKSAIDEIRNHIKAIKDDKSKDLISGQLVSVDVIEHQYKILNENVQLSNTALDGKRQKTDTDDNNKYYGANAKDRKTADKQNITAKSYTYNENAKRFLASNNNYNDLLSAIKNAAGTNNKRDIKDILAALLDIYTRNNNL